VRLVLSLPLHRHLAHVLRQSQLLSSNLSLKQMKQMKQRPSRPQLPLVG
jgi:hypothetical protein